MQFVLTDAENKKISTHDFYFYFIFVHQHFEIIGICKKKEGLCVCLLKLKNPFNKVTQNKKVLNEAN
jgi:hypothetical protein